jgi:flagellum-specific peptidoglycan hydrolase FlgJ
MKIISGLTVLSSIFMALFLFVSGKSAGQEVVTLIFAKDTPAQDITQVQLVSARIATMYGADKQVVQSYVQAAVNLEGRTGVPASVVIAIAILESSFTSYLFTNTGNPFGIKASKPYDGMTFSVMDDGAMTEFRVYPNASEAILDFGKFIKSRAWYADAMACSLDNFPCVVEGLKKTETQNGYSQNPLWDKEVLDLIQKVGLQSLSSQ